ncbi:MAG: hypothetical protein IJW18_01730 [Lachnospiraceae bacterium]|nr:hypothetical protein [Lachnospiraceae bacterium]
MDKKDDGILFFIQRLQEMLFHYSDDVVRAPVHNTQTLINEYLSIEKEVKKGKVKQYQLDVIMSELKESLLADKILKEKYKACVIDDIVNELAHKKGSAVHYLSSIVAKMDYYNACIDYIRKHIVDASHKNEIEYGLRVWISFVVWYGYSPEYIYRYLRSCFSEKVDNPIGKLEEFLNRFDFKSRKYKVYFVFYARAKEYTGLLNKRLNISFEDDGNFYKLKKNREAFVGVVEKDGFDSYGAIQHAHSALNIFMRFYRAFTNRKEELIGKCALVIDCKTLEDLILPVETLGYKNIESIPGMSFAKEIDIVVLGCQGKREETYEQLNKIIDLHNAALKQQDLNDAFVNLWSILEVVSTNVGEQSKIDSVVKSIIPILQSDYYTVVFESIENDLKNNLSTKEYNKILMEINETSSDMEKIACLIFLDKYEKLREEIFRTVLSEYPNIRNKIYKLYLKKDNKSSLKVDAEKYIKRVSWHIYRLYRVRNAIVHAGESHRRIQVLGEHLHIYVDSIIMELMFKLATEERLNSIEDVLIDTELLVKRKYDFADGESVEYSDIEKMLEHFFIK